MTTVAQAFAAYESLSPADKKKFLALLQGLGRTGKPDADADFTEGQMLYDAIRHAFLGLTGEPLVTYGTLCNGSRAKLVLQNTAAWLRQDRPIARTAQMALHRMVAEACARLMRGQPVRGKENALALIETICALVDRAYPGYRINGLLVPVAMKMAEGKPAAKTTNVEEDTTPCMAQTRSGTAKA